MGFHSCRVLEIERIVAPLSADVAEREELTETGLGSTARCCGRRRHRQANSVRVCSPTSRRVASLRPRSAGLTALMPAPRTLVQTGSCRRCPLIHPLHVVVAVLSRMTPFPATVDSRWGKAPGGSGEDHQSPDARQLQGTRIEASPATGSPAAAPMRGSVGSGRSPRHVGGEAERRRPRRAFPPFAAVAADKMAAAS